MNRRSFFGMLAGTAATVGIKLPWTAASARKAERVAVPAASVPDRRAKVSMEGYTSDTFASRVGQVFAFHRTAEGNDPPVHLELIDVEPSPRRATAGARQPFSLLFALRSADATQESTLHLRHDEFEPCAWFVSRVAAPERDRKTAYYEAIFG